MSGSLGNRIRRAEREAKDAARQAATGAVNPGADVRGYLAALGLAHWDEGQDGHYGDWLERCEDPDVKLAMDIFNEAIRAEARRRGLWPAGDSQPRERQTPEQRIVVTQATGTETT